MVRLLVLLGRTFGAWVVRLAAGVIASGYFLFARRRVATSVAFYRALFPTATVPALYVHAWRQFQQFALLFSDRLRFRTASGLRYAADGDEHLQELHRQGRGCVMLMSHVGNWEAAAYVSQRQGYRLLIYMGRREGEQVEAVQKEDLRASGLPVVAVGTHDGSPLDGLAGLRFLREGGFVAMSADRAWTTGQRTLSTRFLGRRVSLPAAPYALALAAGVPLVVFFCLRERDGSYRLLVREPFLLPRVPRERRDDALRLAADGYLRELRAVIETWPHQWGHFEPFLHDEDPAPRPSGTAP